MHISVVEIMKCVGRGGKQTIICSAVPLCTRLNYRHDKSHPPPRAKSLKRVQYSSVGFLFFYFFVNLKHKTIKYFPMLLCEPTVFDEYCVLEKRAKTNDMV